MVVKLFLKFYTICNINERGNKMPLVNFMLDPDLIKDLDICAKLDRRNRTVHLRELILADIKRKSRNSPEAFKDGMK